MLETVRAYLAWRRWTTGRARRAESAVFVGWARRTAAELRRDLQSARRAGRRSAAPRRSCRTCGPPCSLARDGGDLDAMVDIVLALDEPSVWRDLPELWLWTMDARRPRRDWPGTRGGSNALGAAAESAWLAGSLDRATSTSTGPPPPRASAPRASLWRAAARRSRCSAATSPTACEWYWRAAAELTTAVRRLLASAALAACYGGTPGGRPARRGAGGADGARPYPSHAAYLHYVDGRDPALRGDLDEATREYEAAIDVAGGCGCLFVEGVAMVGLASAWVAAGRVAAAADGYRDLLDRWYRAGSSTQLWTTARNAASLLVAHGDAPQTAALLLAAADSADAAAAVTGQARIELDDLRRRASDGMSDTQRSALAARARTMPLADILDEAAIALGTVR